MSTHEMQIRVRYRECDPMGVVHHTVYPIWFEMGRTELLRMTGVSYRELEDQGVLLAVVGLQVRYRRPARYDEVLRLETSLKSVGHVKVEHAYRLFRDEELLVTGETTLACLNLDGEACPLPDLLLAPQPESD